MTGSVLHSLILAKGFDWTKDRHHSFSGANRMRDRHYSVVQRFNSQAVSFAFSADCTKFEWMIDSILHSSNERPTLSVVQRFRSQAVSDFKFERMTDSLIERQTDIFSRSALNSSSLDVQSSGYSRCGCACACSWSVCVCAAWPARGRRHLPSRDARRRRTAPAAPVPSPTGRTRCKVKPWKERVMPVVPLCPGHNIPTEN